MSEIVRPTRDGIHGREYISTSVDIGRKLPHLAFADGQLTVTPPPLMETPLPVIFDVHSRALAPRAGGRRPLSQAAAELGTLAVVRERRHRRDEAAVHEPRRSAAGDGRRGHGRETLARRRW